MTFLLGSLGLLHVNSKLVELGEVQAKLDTSSVKLDL
jgi:hypothetical protein